MTDPLFKPTFPHAIGPVGSTPGAKAPASAPTGGPSFGDELSQALGESGTEGNQPMAAETLATDQRLNELRADLNLVRQKAVQLQQFQAHAAQLYQTQMRG